MTLGQLLKKVPDSTRSLEEAEQYHGLDLQRYDVDELRLEAERIKLALLMIDDRPPARRGDLIDWLVERLRLVRGRLP
jgi:hypothetical protein